MNTVRHPGLPFPYVLVERWQKQARAINSWSDKSRRAAADEVAHAGFLAYLDRALVCPIKFESVPPSWRCLNCGTVDHYEQIAMVFVWSTVNGDPENAEETWTEEADVQTRRCLNCMYDDWLEEIPRSPRCQPDWTINLDGTENRIA